jgi:hypothetical protein
MAQPRAPDGPQRGFPFVDNNSLLTGHGIEVIEQLWRQVVAGYVTVPCEATQTPNLITLTPLLHKEGGFSYGNGMKWSFLATATLTGVATFKVATLTTVKGYMNTGPTQATTGDIVNGRYYEAVYWSSLDGGNGGVIFT